MPNLPTLTLTGASAVNYPSNTGLQLGLTSSNQSGFRPNVLMDVTVVYSGTVGTTGQKCQVQVQDGYTGDWLDVSGANLTAQGQMNVRCCGCAVRVQSHAGAGYGGGANQPRLFITASKVNTRAVGKGY